MKDNTFIHELARPGVKSGFIRFIHSDGSEQTCSTCVNDLTGSRMAWFNNDPPYVDAPLNEIRSVFRDIRKKATVLEEKGDF